jgi:hypothetical protein
MGRIRKPRHILQQRSRSSKRALTDLVSTKTYDRGGKQGFGGIEGRRKKEATCHVGKNENAAPREGVKVGRCGVRWLDWWLTYQGLRGDQNQTRLTDKPWEDSNTGWYHMYNGKWLKALAISIESKTLLYIFQNIVLLKITVFWDDKALIALMMEAASVSETSEDFYQVTRRNIPKDRHRHICRSEKLKTQI